MRNSKGQFIRGHESLLTTESKIKISNFQKGRIKSKQTRDKLSLAHLGKKFSEEHKKNLKVPRKGSGIYKRMVGEKSNNWKGGISFPYKVKNAPRPKSEQCEVCGAFGKDFKKGLFYDHNHKTGKFRGWLCMRCNFALGMVKDNTEILENLIDYLNKNQ